MLPNPAIKRSTARHRVAWWVTIPVCLAVMVLANLAFHRWPTWSVLVGVSTTVALAMLARWAQLGMADLGLARSAWMSGLRWGGACVAVATVAYAAAFLIPAARAVVTDTAGSWSQALMMALLVIPLGTIIPEEFAFRGMLWGLAHREWGRWAATFFSSTVFGLWHVAPALGGGSANEAFDSFVGGGTLGLLIRVAGTVIFTGAAGVLFCELRVRSGSLLAPVLAHWAVNGMGVIFVQLA